MTTPRLLAHRRDESTKRTLTLVQGADLVVYAEFRGNQGISVPIKLRRGERPPSVEELLRHGAEVAQQHRRTFRARATIDSWAAVLPARIVTEDLGDYVEDIDRRAAEGQRWQIYIRTLAAMFWTGVNALGYLFRNLRMKSGA